MDYQLRKRHKWMWMVIAPILLVFLFLVASTLDFSNRVNQVVMEKVEGNAIKEAENTEVKVILTNASEQLLLNIWVKTPLKSTSSVVYEINGKGEKGQLLGQLHGTGTYAFPLKANIAGFIVVDEIKNQQILKLEF